MQTIKTFEDACKAKGLDAAKVLPDFSSFPTEHQAALIAHAKLIIIASAINGEWKPDWNNDDEYKYYPWFDMEKTEGNPAGFSLSGVYCSYSFSGVGSRLCFQSREKANYAVEQFIDLYRDYMVL